MASSSDYEKFHETLKGVSVSLIFSSYFLNNPASVFGHTFIRINKAPAQDGKRYELLDQGVSYGAEADTNNLFQYLSKGLFGGFRGSYSAVPYYYKVREYNNAEARDLWEYELNITPEEVDRLIEYLWEQRHSENQYWYLTENCSYRMLTLLDAAAPRLHLTSQTKKWVVPADTLKIIWNTPGLVKQVIYRPSIRSEFEKRVSSLSKSETKILKQLLDNREFSNEFESSSENEKIKILDTAMDYMDFIYYHQIQDAGADRDFKNKILNARKLLTTPSEALNFNPAFADQPQASHGSRRLEFGYHLDKDQENSYNLGVRFALHDQLDRTDGYPESAEISLADLNVSFTESTHKLNLENFYFFQILSHPLVSSFVIPLSWQIKLGIEKIRDQNCPNCQAGILGGGVGYTFALSELPRITLFTGLKSQIYYIPNGISPQRFIPGFGPAARLRLKLSNSWIALAEAWHRYDYKVKHRAYETYSVATQWSPNKSWGVRLTGENQIFDQNLSTDFFYFY